MKLSVILLTLVTVTAAKSSSQQLLERAAAQLDRLAAFRRTREHEPVPIESLGINQTPEVYEYPDNDANSLTATRDVLMNSDIMKRIDELAATAYKMYYDPKYGAIMTERIKRSGSGDFVSGIASKIVGGVIQGSGGLSRGLSGGSSGGGGGGIGSLSDLSGSSGGGGHQVHNSYGVPVQPYEKPFSIWDFKKAILNTVIQAIKAIAGSALALKGQLIKGGGFAVQAKGRVISSAGEAISSLGTNIASSAIISAPKPVYGPPGYSHDFHHTQDVSYDGPPPSPDATYSEQDNYNHGNYGTPSAVNTGDESGLMIAKPTVEEVGHHPYQQHEDHSNESGPPPTTALEESFGGYHNGPPSSTKPSEGVTGTSGPLQTNQHAEHVDNYYPENKDPTVSSQVYGSPPINHESHTADHHQQNIQQSPHPTKETSNHHQYNSNDPNHQLAFQQIQDLINQHLSPFHNSPQHNNQAQNSHPTGDTHNQNHQLNSNNLDHQFAYQQLQDPRSQHFSSQNSFSQHNSQLQNDQTHSHLIHDTNDQNNQLNSHNQDHQFTYQQNHGSISSQLALPNSSPHLDFKDQNLNFRFNAVVEPLKVPVLDHQNTLDPVSFSVIGLANNGYGVPMHGFEIPQNYPTWKRASRPIRKIKNAERRNFPIYRL